MQAKSDNYFTIAYIGGMRTGRPTDFPRTPFGARLVRARQESGLSQVELAQRLNLDRRVVAHWERRSVTLKPEQIVALAAALNISADDLLGIKPKRIKPGPKSKIQVHLEKIEKLPKSKQNAIYEVLDMAVKSAASS
jgi:transcriptional regulator with XRE-family HTH domain